MMIIGFAVGVTVYHLWTVLDRRPTVTPDTAGIVTPGSWRAYRKLLGETGEIRAPECGSVVTPLAVPRTHVHDVHDVRAGSHRTQRVTVSLRQRRSLPSNADVLRRAAKHAGAMRSSSVH